MKKHITLILLYWSSPGSGEFVKYLITEYQGFASISLPQSTDFMPYKH